MNFALGTIALAGDDIAALAIGDRTYRLDTLYPDLPRGGLRALVSDWDALNARIRADADRLAAPAGPDAAIVENPVWLAPLRYPNKQVCVGAVYRDHLEQMNLPAERWPKLPLFLRPPTTSIVGPGRTVAIPAMTREFDWEIELAVVLKAVLTDASEAEAASAIAGYSVGIDFSCRDLLDRGSPVGVDLIRAKAQDTMGPIGPWIRPADQIADVQQLALKLWINDDLRQDGTTASMLFSVAEQLATISRFITLEPGDVVFTGSPAGSARSAAEYLQPGDRVRAQIEQVGTLEIELYSRAPRDRDAVSA